MSFFCTTQGRYLRWLLLTAGLCLVAWPLFAGAQFNPEINYQGKLADNTGSTVVDGDYDMVFRLYTVASGGSPIWTETRTGGNQVTVTSGLFSVMLGDVNSLSGVDFDQTLYLGVEVESDGEMTPRKVLGAVPAAFQAQEADNAATVGGIASTSLVRSDQADTIEATESSTLLTLRQNGTGNILQLLDGASEVFTVTDSGSVGIGTTTPIANLEIVAGTNPVVQVTDLGGAQAKLQAFDNTASVGTINNYSLNLITGNTNRLTIDSAGNIGIGTTTPNAKLTVAGTFSATDGTVGNEIYGLGASSAGAASSTIIGNGANVTANSSFSDYVVIGEAASAGGFGNHIVIGAGAAANSGAGSLVVGRNANTDYGSAISLGYESSVTGTGGVAIGSLVSAGEHSIAIGRGIGAGGAGTIVFGNQASAGASPDLYIAGATGIYNQRNLFGVETAWLDSTDGTRRSQASLQVFNSSGAQTFLQADATASGVDAFFAGGNVGIGTTSASSLLTVDGDAYITGALYDSTNSAGTNGMVLQTTSSGTQWVATSTLGIGGGGGAADFVGLSDTQGSLTADRLIFTNSGGTALTDSADLTFDGSQLALGGDGELEINDQLFYASSTAGSLVLGRQSSIGRLQAANSMAIGSWALENTTGGDNIGIGVFAGRNLSSGIHNIVTGNYAGFNMGTGNYNVVTGYAAGYNLGDSSSNSLYGYYAGNGLQSGGANVFLGDNAGRSLATSSNSVVVGSNAAHAGSDYTASNLTILGYRAGYGAQDGANNNLFLGYQAADNITTGANNIVIGYDVDAPSATADNQLNIGNLIFSEGVDGTGTTLSSGNVGIKNTAPAVMLHVGDGSVTDSTNLLRLEDTNSTCNFNADTGTPSCGSDRTLKTDIDTIEGELDKILALEPSYWRWKSDDSNDPLKSGFIAQEVEEVLPELVTESVWVDGSTKKFLNIGGMMPYVVGAIKEMWETITLHDERLAELEDENEDLQDRIEALEAAVQSGGLASVGSATNDSGAADTSDTTDTDTDIATGTTSDAVDDETAGENGIDDGGATTTSDVETATTTDIVTDTVADETATSADEEVGTAVTDDVAADAEPVTGAADEPDTTADPAAEDDDTAAASSDVTPEPESTDSAPAVAADEPDTAATND